MKTFFASFLACLLASSALADTTHVSKGDLLKDRQYRTNADVALFVDPTGNDSNACTSTGTAACLTLQGAFNKSPKLLRHRLTVTVAAGNYAGVTISGFVIDPSVQKTTAGVLLNGVLANVTPTTGSATGTASAGTAGSGSTFGTLTDGAATLTVNDPNIVGKLVTITGGTGSGQVRVVVSNTATVLTIAGTWTAPTGTSTYALQSPSAVITSVAAAVPDPVTGNTLSAAGVQLTDNVTGASAIVLQNIGISVGANAPIRAVNTGTIRATQVVTVTTTSAVVIGTNTIAALAVFSASATSGLGLQTTSQSTTTIQTSFFSATTGNGIQITGGADHSISSSQITGALAVQVTGGGSTLTFSNSRCDCLSAANSACANAGTNPTNLGSIGSQRPSWINIAGQINITNCTYGLLAAGAGSQISVNATSSVVSGNALLYGAASAYGGSIVLPTATVTLTGTTAEMSVDTGTGTGTWASLLASFDCLTNLATGSRICRL